MTTADSAKTLLERFNQQEYHEFLTNNECQLQLPAPSLLPWIAASNRKDRFKKKRSHKTGHRVQFISKNNKPHSMQWVTDADKLQQGVRWGIIRTESITGKVIAALGQYNIVAHTRIAKGLISNRQRVKLKLLELYQQRFEALQSLESLVNTQADRDKISKIFKRYIEELESIYADLDGQFQETNFEALNPHALSQIKKDLHEDIQKAQDYLHRLQAKDFLRVNLRARGHHSMLEFVKTQMLRNLYELQGINQDLSYSKKRFFALTRGDLNDSIEDARKLIDDHRADPRNAVMPKHHGVYQTDQGITYDFTKDNLSPAREREVLLAVSFIEDWDQLDCSEETAFVMNATGREPLASYAATKWQTHRSFTAFIKRNAYLLLHALQRFFIATKPWEEESWENKDFHLFASTLRQQARPDEPFWSKPLQFLKLLSNVVRDLLFGIRNIGEELVIKMPCNLLNDWEATKPLDDYRLALAEAEKEIVAIRSIETDRLQTVLDACDYTVAAKNEALHHPLAVLPYHLSPGEQNDILTACVRGIDAFAGLFTHNIYAKDPVGGLLFTAGYAVGAMTIFFPAVSTAVLGATYVHCFTVFSATMGSSKLALFIAGGSTQAELIASLWDTVMHGPSSIAVNTFEQVVEDPVTVAAYLAAAYGIGYLLANGVAGFKIPGLSEMLKEDLGAVPEMGYPIIGAKVGVSFYEALITEENQPFQPPDFHCSGKELNDHEKQGLLHQKTIERFGFAIWLSANAMVLPKLKIRTLGKIERHIDTLYTKEEADSLKKLLYPEKERSIAFQLFSIPLTYMPAILRLAVAFLFSAAAWLNEHPYPEAAVKQAGRALTKKTLKDLNRLIILSNATIYLIYNLFAALTKSTAFMLNMAIGRLFSIFGFSPGHSIHKAFSFSHVFFKNLGEFFYPVRMTKSVVTAEPAHTIKEMEYSYKKLLKSLQVKKQSKENDTTLGQKSYFEFSEMEEQGMEFDAESYKLFF